MRIEVLTADHIREVEANLQPGQVSEIREMSPEVLVKQGVGFAGVDGGKTIFVIGRVRFWEGRYAGWALLSADAWRYMLPITRAVKAMIKLHGNDGRLEIITQCRFNEACRWAEILGFTFHHREEKFLPNGEDANIYVRFT